MLTLVGGLSGLLAAEARAAMMFTSDAPVEVTVLFATNRNLVADGEVEKRYGGDRGPLRFGRCSMEFTPLPGVDSLSHHLPFYVPNERKRLSAAEDIPEAAFWPKLAGTQDRQLAVLIHGYNFDFERACRRAAELQRLLGDSISVVLFTWPSAGNPVAYTRDETNSGWSVPHLRRFLEQLAGEVENRTIHLVGHSLGTRILSRALEGMTDLTRDDPPFAELVLSAADTDSAVFAERWPSIRGLVRRLTLYTSDSDAPLKASHRLHGYPRLGEAGEHLTILDGAETIDASGTGYFELTGHNYQYFHPLFLADLAELLQKGRGADGREHLQARSRDGARYWVLTPPPEPAEEPPPREKVILLR